MTDRQAALARLCVPLGALCVCAATDPHHPAGWFFCPFRVLTGLPCPLCGMTRALASLLRAQWKDALSFHLLSPLVLAAIAAWIIIDSGRALRLWNRDWIGHWALHPAPWYAFFTLCTIYGALRWCGILGSPLV